MLGTAGTDVTLPLEVVILAITFATTILLGTIGWCLREVFRLANAVSRLLEKVEQLDEDHDANERAIHSLRKDIVELRRRPIT